jgi:streptomycin 6-kinase
MLTLPPEFIQTIEGAFKGKGRRWLVALPGYLEQASQRWHLTDIRPLPDLSYSFVAFAVRAENGPSKKSEVVLKLGVPDRELRSGIAALRHYDGRGACRLLGADARRGMLLMERLKPGHALATLEDGDSATEIAAEVMSQLWGCSAGLTLPLSQGAGAKFIRLSDWFDRFKRLHHRYTGKTGPLSEWLVAKAESLSGELLTENKDEVLLHGDFHHFNVVKSACGWLAIDPKGVIGPRGYEVGPLLINMVPGFLSGRDPREQTQRRIAILSERLNMESERIRAWGLCHAVLSAWWTLEDNDPDQGAYSMRCAELFTEEGTKNSQSPSGRW